ncbi:protein phosphatase CheZ [Roseateles toxinivorans]|uniref:Protein phosphatase CheZ n=1 Tax=Roseateles toxinivorans TaxID=270368 RepID=A0A4R6QH82_9BURK|nr:protein phosphatase CheZ [Roseateles toxinivorans]TDP61836.1 chemotaxis protein CheZ [Roseateles toxinivorans]
MSSPNEAAMIQPDTRARLGSIARELHEGLRTLGADTELHRVMQEIPNARERLDHVSRMTENAANKVLSLVESAKPEFDSVTSRGRELSEALARLSTSPDISVERARAMMKLCGDYLSKSSDFMEKQNSVLTQIMMAQDFQDLSGQVIKKVIDIITRTEEQLVMVLVDTAPEKIEVKAEAGSTEDLQGPQVPDKALKQDDVDDLLASLGF